MWKNNLHQKAPVCQDRNISEKCINSDDILFRNKQTPHIYSLWNTREEHFEFSFWNALEIVILF